MVSHGRAGVHLVSCPVRVVEARSQLWRWEGWGGRHSVESPGMLENGGATGEHHGE